MERLYGLVGYPLGHSFSAAYFAAKFERENIIGCRYENFELPDLDALPRLLAEHPTLGGYNVTIPHKQRIIPRLDAVSDQARRIGAVNCVKITEGRSKGYNTDVAGIRYSLRALGVGPSSRALVLGTGGASLAVRYVLGELGVASKVVSRDPARGDMTYAELDGEAILGVDLIVNATPLGTFPAVDTAPDIPYRMLTERHKLFDLVYNPRTTRFLREGARRGARGIDGMDMLRIQAEASWAIWTA